MDWIISFRMEANAVMEPYTGQSGFLPDRDKRKNSLEGAIKSFHEPH